MNRNWGRGRMLLCVVEQHLNAKRCLEVGTQKKIENNVKKF